MSSLFIAKKEVTMYVDIQVYTTNALKGRFICVHTGKSKFHSLTQILDQ